MSPEKKRAMINWDHSELSIGQQCKLVRLLRSSFYDTLVGIGANRPRPSAVRAFAPAERVPHRPAAHAT